MGGCELSPGAYNVVPSRARASIDFRNPSDDVMNQVEEELIDFYKWVEEKEKVKVEWERVVRTKPVDFDPAVQDIVAAAADTLGLSNERMLSGAGHDAQEWASVCNPGEHDGVSHSPREHSTKSQCAHGANVLLRTLVALADES
jgi:N-carbamoyl-L-amino-acid hydrolase